MRSESVETTTKAPDFYLASSEWYEMETPRRGFVLKRLRGQDRDDYLLISIEPPLNGQNFGMGDRDLNQAMGVTDQTVSRSFVGYPDQPCPVLEKY